MKSAYERRVKQDLRRERRQKNRLLRICLLSFFAFLLWVSAVYFCLLGFQSAFSTEKRPAETETAEPEEVIRFANVNWEENIYLNERWLECDRQIYFGTQYTYQAINGESSSALGKYAEFFYRYFQYIISGDAQGYRDCFSDAYPDRSDLPESFTMQKLFDIYALEYGDATVTEADGREVAVKDFIVKYKILENNGTFRDDLPSGVACEQYYRICQEDGSLKIYQIASLRAVTLEAESDSESVTPANTTRALCFGGALLLLASVPVVWIAVILKKKKKKEIA